MMYCLTDNYMLCNLFNCNINEFIMKKLITFLLLITAGSTFAQQVRVIGKTDQQPINQCYIYNADKSISVMTNPDGIAAVSYTHLDVYKRQS